MEPISPSAYWDGVAEAWAARPRQRLWRRYSDVLHARLVSEWLPSTPVRRILKTDAFDEATGELGRCLIRATAGASLVTLDVSMRTLQQARRRHGALSPLAGSVRSLPLSDASFDLVVSTSTLDHLDSLDEIAAALAELRRILRPGGRLVLTLDNAINPVVALRSALPHVWLRALRLVPYETGANCGPGRLERLVRSSGLTPLHVGSLLHCPRMPAVALSHVVEALGSAGVADGYVRGLMAFERLGSLPTRYATGYFVVVVADRG